MKLLTLVLLLSTFSSLALMEVVPSFESCPSFFIRNPNGQNQIIVPTIFTGDQYKLICQRWKNKYRFATVYDTKKRIPVYSAYTFLEKVTADRKTKWKIEPELENFKEYKGKKEMIDSPTEAGDIINQAVNSDYTGSRYTRGHVFPKLFAGDQDQADSTFTLTNIAPQKEKSNGQWAQQVEEPMRNEIIKICRLDQNHLAYIVTGVVPGNNWIPITRRGNKINEGINIPSHFWSAFCCTSRNNNNILIARAYIAEQENFNARQLSIQELNANLTGIYQNGPFEVFPGLIL